MWQEEFKPLPVQIWLAELASLVSRCSESPREVEDRIVRRAYHLSRLSPLAIRKITVPAASERELEAALDREDTEEAAMIVMGLNSVVELLDCTDTGCHVAEFTPKDGEPVRFEAASPALAMVGAWASFLTTIPRV